MAESRSSEGSEEDRGESRGTGSTLANVLSKAGDALVPILVSAGSLIGFVAFAGAVIVWTQLDAVDVPPSQAIAAFPRSQLVAIGASLLLIFGFFGVLAVICSYLTDRSGRPTPGVFRGLLVLLLAEGVAAIVLAEGLSTRRTEVACGILALAIGFALWASFVDEFVELKDLLHLGKGETTPPRQRAGALLSPRPLRRIPRRVRGASRHVPPIAALAAAGAIALLLLLGLEDSVLPWVLLVFGVCFVVWAGAELMRYSKLRSALEREEREAEERRESRRREAEARLANRLRAGLAAAVPPLRRREEKRHGRRAERAEARRKAKGRPYRLRIKRDGAILMALSLGAGVGLAAWSVHQLWLAGSLAAAIVLFFGLWRIAALSKREFMWFGFAVFFSVPLFGTLTLMARNLDDPLVQPMALIRDTDGPGEAIQGIYVTETDDRVYFANVATEGCERDVEPDSGRLMWVPKSEVVALSIGPSENVRSAAGTALEMSYALAPEAETPVGREPSRAPGGERSGSGKGGAPPSPALDTRLDDPGPAVRPNFGTGWRLSPPQASPGGKETLRLSAPNESDEVEGFGRTRDGKVVRVGGVRATVLKEPAPNAESAEFIETRQGQLLRLEKNEPYVVDSNGEYVPLAEAHGAAEFPRYLMLSDSSVLAVAAAPSTPYGYPLKIDNGRIPLVAGSGTEVTLKGASANPASRRVGAHTAVLERRPLGQAWHEREIRFEVPENAPTGPVTVQCSQLAGQPLLSVAHAPEARVSVRMRAGSSRVTFDSSRSSDADGEEISRRWNVAGLRNGNQAKLSVDLPPRLGVYTVRLTVSDESGRADSVLLRMLRPPSSIFAFDRAKLRHPRLLAEERAKLMRVVREDRPAAIEFDGNADDPGTSRYNVRLSLLRAQRMRHRLLHPRHRPAQGDRPTSVPPGGGLEIPVRTIAYGEGCPVDPHPGRNARNRRVDVFVLDPGVSVAPAAGCHARRFESTEWRVPPTAGEARQRQPHDVQVLP